MSESSGKTRRQLPSWRAMHADTSPWAEELQFKFFREAPAWRKLEMAGQLNESVQLLAKSGLEGRFPQASPEEIRRRLADILLGPEIAARVYGRIGSSEDEVIHSDSA